MTMDQDTPAPEVSAIAPLDDSRTTRFEPAAKPRGRFLATLSFFTALTALAGAGYVYYELLYVEPLDVLRNRVGILEVALPRLTGDLDDLQQAQIESLEMLVAEQRDSLADARQSMISALSEVSNQAPPAPREWKLAEVEYLLRIANHRVLMERDVDAALNLLGAADDILLELDDFALYEVRAGLAEEILALSRVRGNDVQGIYLRLEAVKGRLVDLPEDLPEYLDRQPAEESEQTMSLWEALRAELSSYLRLRRFDGATKPLLAPEESVYLELNLRLMLERAQLATLRRQQVVYVQSLTAARDWLGEFLDPENLDVQQIVGELDLLLAVRLDRQLPDVSGSLASLLNVRRGAE